MPVSTSSKRAETYDEIKPLVDLCKAGKLFEVQAWIAEGRPIDAPLFPNKRTKRRSPLETAMDHGFHSLVQVLLEGGASIESDAGDSLMDQALSMRRFDLVKLLVDHGFDPARVDMRSVFNTWDPAIMEYFIENGADLESGNPLAYALCNRIRTALNVFKSSRETHPTLQRQANIAIRYHAKEGNKKWVSLLMWAGADPYAQGEIDFESDEESEEGSGLSALAFAALYRQFEILHLKKVQLDPKHPGTNDVFRYCCQEGGYDIVRRLLADGYNVNDQANGGCSIIQGLLTQLGWVVSRWSHHFSEPGAIDDPSSMDKMKAIHLLAKSGGKWMPENRSEINSARRSLLMMKPEYTVEFVWIMSKYNACNRVSIEDLLRPKSIQVHVECHSNRLHDILTKWPNAKVISTHGN